MQTTEQLALFGRVVGAVCVESAAVCNPLLEGHHYLGPLTSARLWLALFDDEGLTQVQAWRWPTSRRITEDVLELSRWCIGPRSNRNAGSWFNARAVRIIKRTFPNIRQLVSYSELGKHDGGLYRASNWESWPTHHADRFALDGVGYRSGHGSWDGVTVQSPKMRWRIVL